MDSVLSILYDGDFVPPTKFLPDDEAYNKLRLSYCRRQEAFREELMKLNPALDKQLGELLDEQAALASMENEAMFQGSFRLGARLMLEVIQEEPEADPAKAARPPISIPRSKTPN